MVNLQQSLRRYIPKVNIARGNILKHHYHFGCQLFFRIHQELLMKLLGRKFSKKEVVTRIEGHTFLIYDTIVSYLVLDEIRTQQLYRKFRGCKKILDVGGYLGESAVYFNQICGAQVDVYESDKRKFVYMEKNCKPYPDVHLFHGAVVAGEKTYRITYDQDDRGTVGEKGEESLPTFDFFKIISETSYDGIKIDIEGGEYEIMDSIVGRGVQVDAKILFFEFHELENLENRQKLFQYIRYFIDQGYIFEVFDNDDNLVQLTEALSGKISLVNFLFLRS